MDFTVRHITLLPQQTNQIIAFCSRRLIQSLFLRTTGITDPFTFLLLTDSWGDQRPLDIVLPVPHSPCFQVVC